MSPFLIFVLYVLGTLGAGCVALFLFVAINTLRYKIMCKRGHHRWGESPSGRYERCVEWFTKKPDPVDPFAELNKTLKEMRAAKDKQRNEDNRQWRRDFEDALKPYMLAEMSGIQRARYHDLSPSGQRSKLETYAIIQRSQLEACAQRAFIERTK